MSLSAKREYLVGIHGRYRRAGRPHKLHILEEFCLNCGYHRKAVLRHWLPHYEHTHGVLSASVRT